MAVATVQEHSNIPQQKINERLQEFLVFRPLGSYCAVCMLMHITACVEVQVNNRWLHDLFFSAVEMWQAGRALTSCGKLVTEGNYSKGFRYVFAAQSTTPFAF